MANAHLRNKRMKLRTVKREPPDLNITPLIDVVFLLLIFFMVSTTFDKESRIKINLPAAATQDSEEKEVPIIDITVDQAGTFYVNEEEVINTDPETLKKAIAKISVDDPQQVLVITADAEADYQSVMTVMDVSRQLGIVNMTLTGRKPAKQE